MFFWNSLAFSMIQQMLAIWSLVPLPYSLRVPWTARRSNQSILKEISPGCSLEGLMLKLKLQYFGHLMRRADSLEKDPDAGKDWRQEKKRITEVIWYHQFNGHELGQTLGDGEGQGSLVCYSPCGCKDLDMTDLKAMPKNAQTTKQLHSSHTLVK